MECVNFATLGGISASLDNLWAAQSILTTESVTLSALLEHFYRDQLSKVRTSQDEWNQLVQNMVAFRLVDGSFHDGDGTAGIKSVDLFQIAFFKAQ